MDVKRLLFAHLYSIGWKGGFLFPSKDELESPPSDGVFATSVEESDLYDTLNLFFKTILKREDTMGCHTARKSGYLFGFLRGCLSHLSLMMAADHDSPEVAKRYFMDAESVMTINNLFGLPENALGRYRSAHCTGDETQARSCAPGAKFQKPLPELVKGFVENVVGISPTDPLCHHPKHVFEKVIAWRQPTWDPRRQLNVSTLTCSHFVALLKLSTNILFNLNV